MCAFGFAMINGSLAGLRSVLCCRGRSLLHARVRDVAVSICIFLPIIFFSFFFVLRVISVEFSL